MTQTTTIGSGFLHLLKSRIYDDDIAAIVVNDQSRAMRNAWRAIKLFEELPDGVVLHLARINRSIDTSTMGGRMNAFVQAFMDEIYALDASIRAKDSVNYRKSKGITVGLPPFGTVRHPKTGHLIQSMEGAWLMPDGSFIAGERDETPPDSDAIWRGYYECAQSVLELYAQNLRGYKNISEKMKDEGWAFRNRHGQPRKFNSEDVRRIVSNWREYAGLVSSGRAREKYGFERQDALQELEKAIESQAVFSVELLREVATTQQIRSKSTQARGTVPKAYPFALSNILYCATCHEIANNSKDAKLRSRITGWNKRSQLRYRHSDSRTCECKRKSIVIETVEDEFLNLVRLLEVREDAIDLMADIAGQTTYVGYSDKSESNQLAKKNKAMEKHTRALANIRTLFEEGEMSKEEYMQKRDFNLRELARWEAMTTERDKMTLQLSVAVDALKRIASLWEFAAPEDKQLLAQGLFDEIVYDLDKEQIVDFKLKAWAEPFLVIVTMLDGGDDPSSSGSKQENHLTRGGSSSTEQYYSPNGKKLEHLPLHNPRLIEFLQRIAFPQSAEFTSLVTA